MAVTSEQCVLEDSRPDLCTQLRRRSAPDRLPTDSASDPPRATNSHPIAAEFNTLLQEADGHRGTLLMPWLQEIALVMTATTIVGVGKVRQLRTDWCEYVVITGVNRRI